MGKREEGKRNKNNTNKAKQNTHTKTQQTNKIQRSIKGFSFIDSYVSSNPIR